MSMISEIAQNRKHYDGLTLFERMEEYHTYAVSIAIIENFEIREANAYGIKRRSTKENVNTNTIFQAGSISKPVFASAVMCLFEREILDIDTDISKYLVDYDVPTYDNQKHKITLRQILCHNAGLNLHGFAGYQQGQKIPTIEQILAGEYPANNLSLKLIKSPETGYQYSGGGYVLAQKIVTDVCKINFCELMNNLVLSPLFMTHSSFLQPLPKSKNKDIAFGYNIHNLQIPRGYNIMPELSAAGLWTTPSDLALFGIAIMKSLKNESTFLRKKTAELMTSRAYEDSPYGLGFAISESKKGLTFGHGGSNFGYQSNMVFCLDDGSGIVVMQNSDIGREICSEVTNSFKEIYGW